MRISSSTDQRNFEAAVKLNVLVDGQPWDDAPDLQDEEDLDLESLLDDTILETTKRRRLYPRRILPHVVQALKAERKILGFYKTSIQPEDIQKDPDQESLRRHLSAAAPAMVRQAFQVMKSINTLQKQAEGLCQVLNMKPSSTSLQINGEVLGSSCQAGAPPPAGGAMRSRRPLKRAMREAAVAEGYWPRTTEPEGSVGENEAEERFLS
ncbi:PREDICTED: kinetochore-associated protein NSL1 homolog [Cyprinodon variegatus]|uniref:kinetochore-associated protein NSL1 homolog n=1 Tax=Cyprinodon variegatus TaxID=28743 RepID=UPI0007429579|nr:PREDICTED: kinetochore-associated protein NSL1 homolog [Cyprinodon variegatus]